MVDEGKHDQMHMIRHDHPMIEMVAFAIEMLPRVGDGFNRWPFGKQATAHASVEPGFQTGGETLIIGGLLLVGGGLTMLC